MYLLLICHFQPDILVNIYTVETCWNRFRCQNKSPWFFHFGPLICRICPHRLGVLPSRRRVSPLLRPAPWPRVEISSKDPESSRFMNFSSYNGLDGWNMSLPFLCTFFLDQLDLVHQQYDSIHLMPLSIPRSRENRSKTPPKLVRTEAFQDTQNYFKTGPSKCWEWSYTAIFL